MRRFILLVLALAVALGGLVFAEEPFASPTLVFNDASFDYYTHEVAYLHFDRDPIQNVLFVRIDEQLVPYGIEIQFDRSALPTEGSVDHDQLHEFVNIDVSRRSIEIPFNLAVIDYVELLNAFHDLMPRIGFAPTTELVSGNTYVYDCGCAMHENTGLRLTLTPVEETLYARLTLHTPLAY